MYFFHVYLAYGAAATTGSRARARHCRELAEPSQEGLGTVDTVILKELFEIGSTALP